MELTKQIILKDKIINMTIEEIVIQFQALVNKLLQSWRKTYELEDLQQIGNMGLIKAYNTYKPENNISFITYATTVISREFLVNHRNNKSKDIFLSSLNETILDNDSNEIEKITLLKDENTNVEQLTLNNFEYDKIHNILNSFSDRDKFIIELSFIEHKRQTEIAEMLGITQTQVSRIIKKTLIKLRKELGE